MPPCRSGGLKLKVSAPSGADDCLAARRPQFLDTHPEGSCKVWLIEGVEEICFPAGLTVIWIWGPMPDPVLKTCGTDRFA